MNKLFIIISLLVCSGIAQGQIDLNGFGVLGERDCGVWKTVSDTSDWVTVDTLGTYKKSAPDWVYDKVKSIDPNPKTTLTIFIPCPSDLSRYEQYRIDKNTGIRQRRTIEKGGYYEKELSEYEKVVNDFIMKKDE